MPKTDVKKVESEDLNELTDEALDRTTESAQVTAGGLTIALSDMSRPL